MIKTKWVSIRIASSFSEFVERIGRNLLEADKNSSFTVLEFNQQDALFEYTCIENRVESTLDESGEVVEVVFRRVLVTKFKIINSTPGKGVLIVFNPERSIKSLLSAIDYKVGGGVYFDLLSFDLNDILSRFEGKFRKSQVRVDKVRVSDMRISPRSTASMDVKSSENALLDFTDFYQSGGVLVRVSGLVQQEYERFRFDISRSGGVFFDEDGEELFIREVLESISSGHSQ